MAENLMVIDIIIAPSVPLLERGKRDKHALLTPVLVFRYPSQYCVLEKNALQVGDENNLTHRVYYGSRVRVVTP